MSKLWNSFHDKERVAPICKKQLADWGLDYFDLYLVHFPVALEYVDPSVRYPPGWFVDDKGTEIRRSKATIQDTWTAMEALVPAGLARSIGVSNFQAQLLYDLLRYATIPPATLQVEHHPYLVQPLLLQATQAEGITVTAYSSFGPAGFVELDMARAKDAVPLMEAPTVVKIATKHGKTPAQVLLRWATQRGIAVIPKSSSEARMKQNLESVDFNMDEAELAAITALDKNLRFNQPTNVSTPPRSLTFVLASCVVIFPNHLAHSSRRSISQRKSSGSLVRTTGETGYIDAVFLPQFFLVICQSIAHATIPDRARWDGFNNHELLPTLSWLSSTTLDSQPYPAFPYRFP